MANDPLALFDGLASELREVRDSFAASKQSELNALRSSNRTLAWITVGLVVACIGTLAIGGMLMNRMLSWMDETWEMSLGHERRLDNQDRINKAVSEWMLEYSEQK